MSDYWDFPDIEAMLAQTEATLGVNAGPYMRPIGPVLTRDPVYEPQEAPDCGEGELCVFDHPAWRNLVGR